MPGSPGDSDGADVWDPQQSKAAPYFLLALHPFPW
jgi:hypothetical protein